ncbi:MAG: NAD(P)H-dependent oxidoreductase [Lachnospiraceae bacterium]|nr:NAD(P)H-dependent oxidoreductase [Lachnospiraceae bacterium]
MDKILVAYFSVSGTTAKLAETIAEYYNADLFEIEPVEKYTAEDLNWNNKSSRSSIEMNNPDSRVDIKNICSNMEEYNTILIGYPIWWGVAPHIINSFLEAYNLSGKTIIPFATSGGSLIGKTQEYLGPSLKGATLKTGTLLSVFATEKQISALLED